MFPNVRLMVAALFVSVVALIGGFGMFAARRVSHEPLVRLPPPTAPRQLVADNIAKSPAAFAPGEPFNRRFQIGDPPYAVPAKDSPPTQDRHDETKPAPGAVAALPEPGAAEAGETTSVVGEPREQAALRGPEATEQPVVGAAAPAANDGMPVASAPGTEPAPTAAPDIAAAQALSDAAAAEAGQEIKAPVASEPAGEPEPAPALVVAAIEPLTNPPLPHERPKSAPKPESAGATTDSAEPPRRTAAKSAEKKTRHARLAARANRARRIAAVAGQFADQNSGYSQPNFQTAPQSSQPQLIQRRIVRLHRSKVASRKTKASNSASGGPFVSPPSR
jgi:hypothetical protein